MSRRIPAWSLAVGVVGAAGVIAIASRPGVEPAIPARVVNSVTSFASGHPEWAVLRDGRRDTTPLHMGHARHMDPELAGGPLTCVSCHVVDDTGRYMLPISFDTHCASCHVENLKRINVAAGLVDAVRTPHGSVESVTATIDSQINAMIATHPEKFVIVPPADGEAAAGGNGDGVGADSQPSGSRRRGGAAPKPSLEVPRFTSTEARSAWIESRRVEALAKARDACAYCHVSPDGASEGAAWVIASPAIPDRWLPRSHYSHAAHSMLSCDQCHSAQTSVATADILMPGIDSCRECHQPRSGTLGGAPTECVLCHIYHAPAPVREGALSSAQLRAVSTESPSAQSVP